MCLDERTLYRYEDKARKLFPEMTPNEREILLYPLKWWICRGCASATSVYALCDATERQAATILKRLAKGGSVEEALERMKAYLFTFAPAD